MNAGICKSTEETNNIICLKNILRSIEVTLLIKILGLDIFSMCAKCYWVVKWEKVVYPKDAYLRLFAALKMGKLLGYDLF